MNARTKALLRTWRNNADCFSKWADQWSTNENKTGKPDKEMVAQCRANCDTLRGCADAVEGLFKSKPKST